MLGERDVTVVRVERLPDCDYCRMNGIMRPARYDFRTLLRAWANGCVDHYLIQRADTALGTGKGQLLIRFDEDESEIVDAHVLRMLRHDGKNP